MRLLGVELTRFRSRRAIVLMLIGAALLTALLAATTIWETRPVSEADRAAAEASAEREAESGFYARDLRQCERDPQSFMGPEATVEDCQQLVPQPEWFLERAELDLADVNEGAGVAIAMLVTSLLVVIGTTFAGADWASGSISNQLLFEPRRGRIWLAKAAAVLVGSAAVAAVLLAAFWLVMYLVAESRGIETSGRVLGDIVEGALRGVALAIAGAVGALSLTMLLRSTVGALATLFAYAVGGEILLSALPIEGLPRWSMSNNVLAWLLDGYEYYDPTIICPISAEYCDQMASLSLAQGGWYLAALLLLVGAASLLLFRRRDIP